MKLELVNEWMTRDLITISPTASLPDAYDLMTSHKIRRLPVVDENGRLLGIVTYGDVRGARPSPATSLNIWELNFMLARLSVAEIMTPDPLTISEHATIGEAAQMLLTHTIGSLPVVNAQGTLVGIITESDIFRLVVHEWQRAQGDSPEPYARYGS
ncbi:MAG: CBS domain-containing protein [Chloroflexi bacterium]|nr:CBS domain-containing protein [Chloroflexota bacterium]